MYILFYNTMFSFPLDCHPPGLPDDCILSTDRSLLSVAEAVVFHIPTLIKDMQEEEIEKREGQYWVAWYSECEENYPWILDPEISSLFDVYMNYHLSADVVLPCYHFGSLENLRIVPPEKDSEHLLCAFISSPFNKSGRIEYLKALMNYLPVHSYGTVLNNRYLPSDQGIASKMNVIRHYKFCIAFENAIGEDYVTEKFYQPLYAGCVPIYMGAPNIRSFSPGEQAYIDVRDFDSPSELARYLRYLDKHAEAYSAYFRWKSQPFQTSFLRLVKEQEIHPFVRLASLLKKIIPTSD